MSVIAFLCSARNGICVTFYSAEEEKFWSLFTLWISNEVEGNNPSRYQATSITWYLSMEASTGHKPTQCRFGHFYCYNLKKLPGCIRPSHNHYMKNISSLALPYTTVVPFYISWCYIEWMMEINLSLLVFQALLEAVYVNSAQCLSYSATLTMSAILLQETIILIGCQPLSPCQWAWLL